MKRRIIEITLLFLSFYLPGFFARTPAILDVTPYMLQYLLIGIPQALLIVYIIWIQRETSLRDFGIVELRGIDLAHSCLLYLGLFVLFFIISVFVSILPEDVREAFRSGYRWQITRSSQMPLALLFCMTTGYREELFFRAYLLTRFTELGLAFPIAAAVSTVLFASGHVYQGWGGILYAVMHGILFSFAFSKKKNLHILALSHGLYNFTVLFLSTKLPV
jgi:membrane protease YdiL (CAAX protease family)